MLLLSFFQKRKASPISNLNPTPQEDNLLAATSLQSSLLISIYTTGKVSAPEGDANPHSFMPALEIGYFENLAKQGFQNNPPSRADIAVGTFHYLSCSTSFLTTFVFLFVGRGIAILRLVRYGNVPLPKAGAHFHVLQSHENRYKQARIFERVGGPHALKNPCFWSNILLSYLIALTTAIESLYQYSQSSGGFIPLTR